MRIVVSGSGGVGGCFGGRLAATGIGVAFVGRGAHLDAIRRNGLEITSTPGDARVAHVNAVGTIGDAGAADLIIIGVKLRDTEGVAETLRSAVEQADYANERLVFCDGIPATMTSSMQVDPERATGSKYLAERLGGRTGRDARDAHAGAPRGRGGHGAIRAGKAQK